MKKSRVLITGAKGFVGTEIVKLLEKQCGRVVTVESNNSRRNIDNPPNSVESYFADITDEDSVARLEEIGAADAVVHSAGLAHQFGETKREDFQRVNVAGTANVLELAGKLGVKHFILISSVAVYGHSKYNSEDKPESPTGVGEDAECAPEDFYAESKLDGEKLARRVCADKNIRLTILRLATVVGEQDRGNFLKLIRAIDRRRFVWIGSGENYKSLVHREDVARACLAVLENDEAKRDAGTEIFNVSANFLKMDAVVRLVGERLHKKIPNFFIPAPFVNRFFRFNSRFFGFGKIERLEKTVSKWLADDVYAAEKIKRRYGFEARISAEKAIEREVEWYIANK